MSVDQVLLLTLAAPVTYLLLFVLLRLENLLPDPAPPARHTASRTMPAAAPAPAPDVDWSVLVTGPIALASGDGESATWTIPLPVAAAAGPVPRPRGDRSKDGPRLVHQGMS
jgi:hypothetical protein